MASSDTDCDRVHRENNLENDNAYIDIGCTETLLKKGKARAKSNFTRARNNLESLLDEDELQSRRRVREACSYMDSLMEKAMETIASLTDFYLENREYGKGRNTVLEMDVLEKEYSATSESAREYLAARRDERSSVASETLSIDFVNKMKVTDQPGIVERKKLQEVSGHCCNVCSNVYLPRDKTESSSTALGATKMDNISTVKVYCDQAEHFGYRGTIMQESPKASQFVERKNNVNNFSLNPNTADFVSTTNNANCAIGQDLLRHLKRVEIPVFSGDKTKYQSWKAAFLACIDSAPATGEYKLLQLRQYLSGEALKAIENLGHSSTAYEAAKDRLERKFGGRRRQIAVFLEEIDKFSQVRVGNAKELEKFADPLDVALINLKETG